MKINETIRQRRIELGFSDVELAEKSGLSIYEYGDIESDEDELVTIVLVKHAKALLALLRIDIIVLLGITQIKPVDKVFYQTPAELVRLSRERLGYSISEFSDLIGYYDILVESLETIPDYADNMAMATLLTLETELKLQPGQLILSVWNENDQKI